MRGAIVVLVAAVLSGCGRLAGGPESAIRGGSWRLVELGTATARPGAQGGQPTLQLNTDNTASGNAGCNSFGGSYTVREDSLRFGMLAMTRMACEGHMDQEQRYAAALSATRTWRVRDGRLELMADGRVLARFER